MGREVSTSLLRRRIQELAKQHGSLRAAARVLEVDAGYLSRLQSGEKDNCDDNILRKMGLRRIVNYERIGTRASGSGPGQRATPSPE